MTEHAFLIGTAHQERDWGHCQTCGSSFACIRERQAVHLGVAFDTVRLVVCERCKPLLIEVAEKCHANFRLRPNERVER